MVLGIVGAGSTTPCSRRPGAARSRLAGPDRRPAIGRGARPAEPARYSLYFAQMASSFWRASSAAFSGSQFSTRTRAAMSGST
jgi:hypothetical protein